MLLSHIGFAELGDRVDKALEICGQYERKVKLTGRDTGGTGAEFGKYVTDTVRDPKLTERWQGFVKGR